MDGTFSQDNALRSYSNVTANVLISAEHSAGGRDKFGKGFLLTVTHTSEVSNYVTGKYTETCIKQNRMRPDSFRCSQVSFYTGT
jgi:hypothetical protein